MFEQMFELAVVISAVDHLTAPMRKAAAQMGVVSKHSQALKKQLDSFKTTALVGGAITGAGLLMADGLTKAVERAGEFQTKLVTIQGITGATANQMSKLSDTIMNTSAQVSMFNDMQVGGFAQQLASGGFPKVADVQKLLLPMSQFAEVQQYEGKTTDPSEAVNMAIGMAHMFGHYDPTSLTKFLDTFNKYSVMQPGNSQELNQTLSYLAPTAFRQLHMNENDVMSMAALANRVGLNGSHGGTNAADMVLRLIPGLIGGMPTKTKTPAAYAAMQQLGLINSQGQSAFFKNGQITNFSGMIQTLINASKGHTTEQMTAFYKSIFGIQGGRAASIFADPKTLEQLQAMTRQLSQTKSMSQMQEAYLKSPEGQLNLLKSNSMTLMLRVAMQLATILNPLIEKVNNLLSAMLKFTEAHPKVARYIATFASMATAVALIVGPMLLLVGALGYISKASLVSQGFKLLGTSIAGALGPVTLMVSAGYLLYEAWTHNWGGIQQKTASVINWLKQEIPKVTADIQKFLQTLGIETTSKVTKLDKNGNFLGTDTVRKFHIPSWAKWAAGIIVARKGLDMFNGGILKTISGVRTLKNLMGEGKLFAGLGKGTLKLFDGGFGKLFGKGTWNITKLLGKQSFNLGKLGFNLGGKLFNSTAIKTAISDFKLFGNILGKGVGKGAGFLGKAALNDLKWLGSNMGKIAQSFGSLALNVGKSTAAFVVNAAKTVAVKTAQLAVAAATKVWTGIQIALDAVMDANPLGIIIVAVVGLIAVIVLLVTHWKQVKQVVEVVWNSMKQFAIDIGTTFTHLWKEAVDWGKNIVTGLWNGIKSMGSWIKSNVSSWISDVVPAPIRHALGINSPSRLMMQYGMYTAQGLALGMTQHQGLVSGASQQLVNAIRKPTLSSYAQLSPRATGSTDGDVHIHLGAGAIVVQAASGREAQAGNQVYQALTKKTVAAVRSRGLKTKTVFS